MAKKTTIAYSSKYGIYEPLVLFYTISSALTYIKHVLECILYTETMNNVLLSKLKYTLEITFNVWHLPTNNSNYYAYNYY